MERLNEIQKRINKLSAQVSSAIDQYETKELTGGTNGYPEPYRGVLLIPSDADEVEALKSLTEKMEGEVRDIESDLEDVRDEAEEKGDDDAYNKADNLLGDLADVELEFSQAEWRDGWGYANCYDMHLECKRRDEVVSCNVIAKIGELHNARYMDDVAEEMGFEWGDLEKRAEKRDMDVLDWLAELADGNIEEDVADLKADFVIVEYGDMEPDNPELEYETFETREAAEAFCAEPIINCPPDYDNKNYAVGLRIFGFTADLHDRLNMGGGMAKHEETIATGLNVPKYKH